MSKFMRSQHVPLAVSEQGDLKEEFDEFSIERFEAGTILKALREENHLSVSELARKVKVAPGEILMMERGEQTITLSLAKEFEKIFDSDYHLFL